MTSVSTNRISLQRTRRINACNTSVQQKHWLLTCAQSFAHPCLLPFSDKQEGSSPIQTKTSKVSSDDESNSSSSIPSALSRLGNRTVEDSSKPSLKSRLLFKTDTIKEPQTGSSQLVLQRPGGLAQGEGSVGLIKKTDSSVVSIPAGKRLGGNPVAVSNVSPPSGPGVRKFGIKSKAQEKTAMVKPQVSAPPATSGSQSSSPTKSSPLKLFVRRTAPSPVTNAGNQLGAASSSSSTSSSSSVIPPRTQLAAERGHSNPTTRSTTSPVQQSSKAVQRLALPEMKMAPAEPKQGVDQVDVGVKTPVAPQPVRRQTSGEKSHPEGKRRSSMLWVFFVAVLVLSQKNVRVVLCRWVGWWCNDKELCTSEAN